MDGIRFTHSNAYHSVVAEEFKGHPFEFKPSFQSLAQSQLGGRELELRDEPPSVENFIYNLQKCRKEKNLQFARHLHACIHYSGLETNTVLGDYLVPTFVECGSVLDAQHVFSRLCYPNEYSWSSLIRGYTDLEDFTCAFQLYHQMQEYQVHPTMHTFLALLQSSARLQSMDGGFKVHMEIVKEGLEEEPFIGNTLVDMYAKCGSFAAALDVFEELIVQDVVSWTALIAGYVEHMLGEEALCCFRKMQLKRVSPNVVTLVCSLKAAEIVGDIDVGREIHATVLKVGLEEEAYLGSALIGMYATCESLEEAQEVFDNLQVRDVVLWNVLIAGYADRKCGEETLKCLGQMQQDGFPCNAVSFACGLTACGHLGALERGQEVHAAIAREGFESDVFVSSSLVDMYAKCNSLVEARDVLDAMPFRSLVSWSALITGYAQNECGKEALYCFEQMQEEGLSPDAMTFASCLKACGSIDAIGKGREMHLLITKEGLEDGQFIGSALVSMYAKCGALFEAQEVFLKLPIQGLVLRNALMAGYAEHGCCKEAQACFEQMQLDGIFPNVASWNAVICAFARQGESDKAFSLYAQMQEQALLPDKATFVSLLNACAGKTALEAGRKLYCCVQKSELDSIMATAIINMYTKCGSTEDAQLVFDAMPTKDVVGWTALIAGYGRQGESELVFHWFEKMKQEGIRPNKVTLLSVLNACSHLGLVNEGQAYFDAMVEEYGIIPNIQHHNCMVDLHKRAGQLDEAIVKFENMPFKPNSVTWSTVLSGGSD